MVRSVRVVVVPAASLVRSDAQLRTQPVKVCAAAVLFELAGNLHLLGLGSAAPHWLDPLERPEPVRPHDIRLAGFCASYDGAATPQSGSATFTSIRTGTTVPALRP